MTIFKAYDIRGLYGKELTDELAYKIGRALVTYLKAKQVVIGYDMRESSKQLFDSVARGVMDQGADVISIGLCSTPMLYFAARNKEAAVMITASHNSKEYNGLKLCRANAITISADSGIDKIKEIVEKNKFSDAEKGKIAEVDIKPEYLEYSLKLADGVEGQSIVFDFGNGMGALEFIPVFDKLDVKKKYLFKELDGNFPNHEANPIKPENLKALQKEVVKQRADIGIATDGDCDRVGFVDEKGNMVPGDLILALIAEQILQENPGEKILYEVRSSWAVKEAILANGGKPLRWKPGHSIIKDKMKKDNAILGGEKSGHYFFRDAFFCDSPLIASFIVLKLMKQKGKKLSELIRPLMKYYNTGEVNMEAKDKDAVLKKVEQHFNDGKIYHIDGVTVEYKDWWFNLRKSNTEPLLRLNLEAKTKELMEEKKKEVMSLVKANG